MDFEIDDALDRVDRDVVWDFLSTQAYWHRWRQRADVERPVDLAWRVVGAYRRDDGAVIGFARAFSDGVFVLDEARGRGVGKAVVREMIESGPGRDFRWMLHTDDAHRLYRSFGFDAPDGTYLERPISR